MSFETVRARVACPTEAAHYESLQAQWSGSYRYVEARESALKIATFNINNINKRLANLIAWLETAEPDVVCLQELKAEQNAFPESALRQLGYRAVWHGQRSWNGVAILARDYEPVLTR